MEEDHKYHLTLTDKVFFLGFFHAPLSDAVTLEFPPDTEDPAYRAIFKTPTTHADKVRYDTQSLLNEMRLELDPGSKFLDKTARANLAPRVAAIDPTMPADLEDIMNLVFETVLDHDDNNGTGSKMAAFCADVLHALRQHCPEFREVDKETGEEVGRVQVLATKCLWKPERRVGDELSCGGGIVLELVMIELVCGLYLL